jgi:hypothetical protein
LNSSQISRLPVIGVIVASLLAVGVVAIVSMAEEADAGNRISQSSSVAIDQSASTTGGGTASSTATVTQSNSASQSNGDTVSQSSSTTISVCQNGECTTVSSTN